MAFYPKEKVAAIYMTKNDEESDRENKLGLTEIYNFLAQRKGAVPDEMSLVIFDVDEGDTETHDLIAGIHEGRNLGPLKEVKVLPSDEEWDMILATRYYVKLLQIINKPVQKVIIRDRDHFDFWNKVTHINRIVFSFLMEQKTPVPGTVTDVSTTGLQPDFDGEEQGATPKALLAKEPEDGDLFQAEVNRKSAHQILDVENV
ncbi:hypothetical protein Cpir12675_002955 [Ceratocystis pirilliformis]|uniref:Uncharacterized protein n=1 Tax=Ceratocystis pirilliformis TaxID=259994 RepID=A0ABR3Z7H3_9PEZI